MIIKKLKLYNFRNFINDELEFSSSKINMIVGHGGSGKTTLVYAIKWVLYGKLPFWIKNEADLLNVELKNSMSVHEEKIVYVEIEFEYGGREHSVRRQMKVYKTAVNRIKCEDSKLLNSNGDEIDEIKIRRYFEQNILEDLVFIDGERHLRNRKKALQMLLDDAIKVDLLEDAFYYCNRAKHEYEKMISSECSESDIVRNQKYMKAIAYIERMMDEFEKLRREKIEKGYALVEDEFRKIVQDLEISSGEETLENFFNKEGMYNGFTINLSEEKAAMFYLAYVLACRKVQKSDSSIEECVAPIILDSFFRMPVYRIQKILEYLVQMQEQVIVIDNLEGFSIEGYVGATYRLENNLDWTTTLVTKI